VKARLFRTILGFAAALVLSGAASATTLTGQARDAAGNPTTINGVIWFTLSQNGNVLASGGCGGPYQIGPGAPITFTLTSGTIQGGASIVGNDCISPANTYYIEMIIDSNGGIVARRNVTITGASADIGSLPTPSLPSGTGVVAGTVTNVATAPPLTGGPITTAGMIELAITTSNDGGAVVKQAATPGTQQTGNANLSGTVIAGAFSGPLTGAVTGNVTGNASGSAATFTGSLAGDVTGTQSATTVGKINGTSMAGLATGIVKNTTTTGIPSIAVAGDFPTLNQNTTGTAANVTGVVALANGGTAQTTAILARSSSGLDIEAFTGHGDSVYTILATDRTVGTNAAFTQSRTWTLPAASAVNAGGMIVVADIQGTVTGTNTLVVSRAGSDTINGTTSYTLGNAYDSVVLVSDGSSKWQVKPLTGIATALKSATTNVDVSAATAPSNTQVLTATSSTTATWQTPGAGGGGYATIQEEGSSQTQRTTLNFIGAAITAADNAGSTRTDVTLSQSPASATLVGVGRTITATAPLRIAGGASADLSADRTLSITANASHQSQPADPTGTTSTIQKMMGLAGSITPATTGKVLFIISGTWNNTGSVGQNIIMRYGTGTPPANGAAVTGNAIGSNLSLGAVLVVISFTNQAIVTGLSVGTAYWFDLAINTVVNGTASVYTIMMSAAEF
jgi:hypothetical protein